MKEYCSNPRSAAFADYGGRGITVYLSWLKDFSAFYAHVGPRPSPQHTLERIDNDRGYEPGNVRWDTRTAQARNRRSNRLLTFDGRTLSVAEWGEIAPVNAAALHGRLKLGWTVERALTEPMLRPRTGAAGKIATKHKRRARVAGNGGSFTAEEWLDLCEQFGHRCACCRGKKPLAADHIVPVSKGGTSYIWNIQPLCKSCNTRKGTKIIDYRSGTPQNVVQLKLAV